MKPHDQSEDPQVPQGSSSDNSATQMLEEKPALFRAGEIRILVLDDDPTICELIQGALQACDLEADILSDPVRIEGTLQKKKYDLIILDYVIPGLESDQVLEWVRIHQPDASIVVVTGYPSIDSALSCLRARTYDYITKPFELGHLQQVVQAALEHKGLLRMSEAALRELLGQAIRERRKQQGLTLAQMAQRTGVSLGYLSQIELGKNSASVETLYRIALGLGVKLSELFQAVEHR